MNSEKYNKIILDNQAAEQLRIAKATIDDQIESAISEC